MKSKVQYKAIELINGISHFHPDEIDGLASVVCDSLGIDKTDEIKEWVLDAVKIYFNV
jgi:hypothetical protein